MSIQELRASIFDALLKKYSRHLIPAHDAGLEINGMSPSAVNIAICRRKFPLPTTKIMGIQMVRLADLAAFLADPSISFSSKPPLAAGEVEKKRQRGQRGPGKRRQPHSCGEVA